MNSHWFNLHRFRRALVVALVTLASAVATAAGAQTTTGMIRGTVTSGGAPVANAQIQLRNVSTGAQRGTITREDGTYTLAGVAPATYEMSIRSEEHTSELQPPCN